MDQTSVLAGMRGLLPGNGGLLPKWMLFVRTPKPLLHTYIKAHDYFQLSILSIGNSVQCYRSLDLPRRMYNADPETPALKANPEDNVSQSTATGLSARTFGTWTIITSVVRLYAAYNIDNPAMYKVAFATYLVAFGHFTSEWLLFKTARWNSSLASPLAISTGTMVWMLRQWRWYV
jgi:hypothetical protein